VTKFASNAALVLLAGAAAWLPASLAAQQTPPRFTGGTDAVLVDVLVTRGAKPVPDLKTGDFVVIDSGVEQKAELIAVESLPVNLLLALDTSASVRGPALDQLKAAAKAALASLRPSDEAALVTFAHNLALAATWTSDRAKLTQAIEAVSAQGSTALSDAVFATLGIRGKARSRTLVLLFTDGDDTASWLGPADVLEAARRADAVVYGVTLPKSGGGIVATDDLDRLLQSDPRLYRRALVPLLARETGGESLPATDVKDLSAVFVDAVSRFNTRYVLSYTPAGVPASGWHPIEVKVSASGVDVRARRGYAR
jgi:Ca-activated chloride channel family protein